MQQIKAMIEGDFAITINSRDELIELIEESLVEKQSLRIVTFNPEMMIESQKNENFKRAIQSAQVLIPDGIGTILLLRKKGFKKVQRQPGIELAWIALQKAIKHKLPIALVGSTDQALEGAIQKIQTEIGNPNLVYSHNGFLTAEQEENVLTLLAELQPSLVLFALPFQKQETLLQRAYERGLQAVSFGVGGSFDVWANLVTRAPVAWQNLGIEWLWRVVGQPFRIQRIVKMAIPFLKIYFGFKG